MDQSIKAITPKRVFMFLLGLALVSGALSETLSAVQLGLFNAGMILCIFGVADTVTELRDEGVAPASKAG